MSGFSKLKPGSTAEGVPQQGLDLSDFAPGLSERRGDPKEDEAVADRVAQRRGLAEEPVRRVPLKRGSTVNDKLFISVCSTAMSDVWIGKGRKRLLYGVRRPNLSKR